MHAYIHSVYGYCLWNILTVLVVIVMAIVMVVHIARQRGRDKEFKKDLESEFGPETTDKT